MKFYHVYVLLSLKDRKFYTFTSNLKRRLIEHNNGEVKSTKHRTPFELLNYEGCKDKYDALHREKYLKTAYGKRYLKNRMKNNLKSEL